MDMAAVAEVTADMVVQHMVVTVVVQHMVPTVDTVAHMVAVTPDTVVALTVPHRKVGMADTRHHNKNHNTAVAQNMDIPVLDKPDNQDNRVAPVGLLSKRENPALLVLPKENGLSDHYGRKEANCVEDAPKAV